MDDLMMKYGGNTMEEINNLLSSSLTTSAMASISIVMFGTHLVAMKEGSGL